MDAQSLPSARSSQGNLAEIAIQKDRRPVGLIPAGPTSAMLAKRCEIDISALAAHIFRTTGPHRAKREIKRAISLY
ncbi:hypothetical protein [Paractinoplanes hotanensis]|uniref:Uncharacterized protein n=1 Tax=Paractinoplanes hotanensis TaxID=2906497 RepID=A0ABT0Y5C9_9ACTN|nr:hypothetical protein [Actinoplanes hotanensis]MCM4081237.1 hypothetical protein [Actinoplanes hotanensis]